MVRKISNSQVQKYITTVMREMQNTFLNPFSCIPSSSLSEIKKIAGRLKTARPSGKILIKEVKPT